MKDPYIPRAGKKPNGEPCNCICHKMVGVNHMMACCYSDLKIPLKDFIKDKKEEK